MSAAIRWDSMRPRYRIVWLTGLQGGMVLVGLAVIVAVKQLYLRLGMHAALREALRADILGRESFWSTPAGAALPWLGIPVMLVVARNAASVFMRAGRKKRQIKRDLVAALLVERVRRGAREPFSLYLRSFSGERELKRKKGFWWYVLLEGDLFGLERETLELELAAGLRRSSPLIAVGQPGERLGAGRLPLAAGDWEALVVELMERATLIFVVPAATEGVMAEMRHVRAAFHSKAFVVMPPVHHYGGDAALAERRWNEGRDACRRAAITLPLYQPRGALVQIDGEGGIREIRRL